MLLGGGWNEHPLPYARLTLTQHLKMELGHLEFEMHNKMNGAYMIDTHLVKFLGPFWPTIEQ